MEQWKDIIGYPGYRVSDAGNIWSKRSKLILQPVRSGVYLGVHLYLKNCPKTFTIHRLVALHFIPNPDSKPTVNHKDKDKTNNCVSNLEWATYSEQEIHKNLTFQYPCKAITLTKDGVDYEFDKTRDAFKFLKTNGIYWNKLKNGEVETVNGYKIKNIPTV